MHWLSLSNVIEVLANHAVTFSPFYRFILKFANYSSNIPFSYSRIPSGTSLQLWLMQLKRINYINLSLMLFQHMNLHCKLVPVQCMCVGLISNFITGI